jgi:hypothetical protein
LVEYRWKMLVEAKQKGRARLMIFEITRSPKKKEPPGENLGITLKINKLELLERNSMQQNDIDNIPLPRGPGPKKKNTKRERTWDKLPGVN